MVLSDRTGMKRARVDHAATSISSEELRKGHIKVIGNEGGNDILVAVRNDKEIVTDCPLFLT